MEVIKTQGLTKCFGSFTALNDISLQVNQGDIYGFLGLNGAGKTTLVRTLLRMVHPDSGTIHLFGKKLDYSFRQWNDIGYMVETPYSYPNLTVIENLKIYYHLRALDDKTAIEAIIDKLKLGRYKNIKAKNLSLGNQQRLGLAKALMHNPKLLLLDEPINGLDPEGIIEVRELLKAIASEGVTIFLSSHILSEIDKLATRIGIIHQGNLIKEISHDELNKELTKRLVIDTANNTEALAFLLETGCNAWLNKEALLETNATRFLEMPEYLTKSLAEKGLAPRQIFVQTEDLEMYFLRTIKQKM